MRGAGKRKSEEIMGGAFVKVLKEKGKILLKEAGLGKCRLAYWI
jgi:hypothetical protein